MMDLYLWNTYRYVSVLLCVDGREPSGAGEPLVCNYREGGLVLCVPTLVKTLAIPSIISCVRCSYYSLLSDRCASSAAALFFLSVVRHASNYRILYLLRYS